MNFKNAVITIAASAQLLSTSCNNSNERKITPEQIHHMDSLLQVLPRTQLINLLYETPIQYNDSLHNEYMHRIDQKPNTDTMTIDIDRIKKWPLWTMKLPHTLWRLLWNDYPSDIFYRYNPELLKSLNSTENLTRVEYNKINKDIKIPSVYPDLADFFVPSLQDFITQHPEIKEFIGDDKEVIIVTRDENWKYSTSHYNNNHVNMAHHGAFGSKSHPSPEWVFRTNLNADRIRYNKKRWYFKDKGDAPDSIRTSHKYNDAAMPYAIPIAKDSIQMSEMLHTREVGIDVQTGKALSHWCFWQTWSTAVYFTDQIGERKVKLISFNLYDKKEKKSK